MQRWLFVFWFSLSGLLLAQEMAEEPHLQADLPAVMELYRWFHAHPELSRRERQTATRLAQELRRRGLEVEEGVGGTGLMAILRGQPGGVVVLYRADMDALPVTEKTGLPYASRNEGVMHACGHDIHMSCAVAALGALAKTRDQWKGTVLFVGQPAEEVGAGAEEMMADPRFAEVMERAGGTPVLALALHDNAALDAGTAALSAGYISANVDSVDILVHGSGGHGAYPHSAIDPIVIGSEIVMALQTIVSRRLKPGTRAVVTVGKFEAGTKHNIIPPSAQLSLTVRSYEDEVRDRLISEIRQVAEGIALAHNAPRPPEVQHDATHYTPSGYNDPDWVERLRPVFLDLLGEDGLRHHPPTMGGEDFSEYSRRLGIPSVMFALGACAPDATERPGLHSDRFAPDPEPTIRTGARLMVGCLREALSTEP